MDPPKRAALPVLSRANSSDAKDGDAEQNGRSPATLHATRAAAVLRTSSRKDILHGIDPLERHASGSSDASTDSDYSPTLSKATDHDSSTQTPSLPLSSTPAANLSVADLKSDASISDLAKAAGLPPPPRRPNLRTSQIRPQLRSPPEGSNISARSPGALLTMQDLGSDYTRYFNPFTDSARIPSEKRTQTPIAPITPGSASPLAGNDSTNPFLTPNVSSTKLHAIYDPEKNLSLIDDRLIAPYEEKGMASWPLKDDQEESDDEMHMPRPDDDIRYRPKLKDHFTRESIVGTIGLAVMAIGLLFMFVALPILSFAGIIDYNSAYGGAPYTPPNPYKPQPWATVNDKVYPFLQNIRTGLIDPDTPKAAMKKTGQFGDEFELVFSDEFNQPNRTFYEGDDPYFFAGDFWYGATRDLEWYDPDAVTTYDGTLELRLDKYANHGLQFRSGMLNSWNHLCFKGGIFEVSVSLPGPGGIPGLWPGAWTMGNLGRPGYLSTTDGMWPYTYQACDVGITPNQSSSDGLSNLPGQRLPSCTCPGEDHPTPGKGRGAPEIDIIEVGATWPPQNMPIATQSFQVAPFDVYWYPNYNFTAFPDYSLSWYNGYTGGPYQQAISATTNLNKNWFDGKEYQRYSFEYAPGEGEKAYISWKVGGQTMFMMDGRAIGPNGNIQARQVSEEPMSLILNLGISEAWTWIDWENLKFPAVMRIDYVRWYQKKGQTMVTCDPPGFETTKYIKDHINAYTNPNFTRWDQTGHAWPKHKLNSKC